MNKQSKTGVVSRKKTASKNFKSPAPAQPKKAQLPPSKRKPLAKRNVSAAPAIPLKKNRAGKIFRNLFVIFLLLLSALFLFNYFFFNNVNSNLNKANLSRYAISPDTAAFAKSHKIVNIAIFGVDGRSDVEGDRADTIMIATADYEHQKIKVSSIMRDTYVYINGKYQYDKLNSAYAYGGPDLTLQTLNKNFDMAITDYITINFESMVSLVDAVGGVNINIENEEELEWLNKYLMDVNAVANTHSPFVKKIGSQLLDGAQALAYCRIRYVGDGDFDRTQRQRTVFEQILSKALTFDAKAQYDLLKKALPYVETSLSDLELLKYAANLALLPSIDIDQSRFPTDDLILDDTIGEISYLIPNTLSENIDALYAFIYEEQTTPRFTSAETIKISAEIEELLGLSYDYAESYNYAGSYNYTESYYDYESYNDVDTYAYEEYEEHEEVE